jgi:hypothetical protein
VKSRPILAYVVLAFLLFTQQLGITHAISHLSSDTTSSSSQKKLLPGETQCAQCLAFAALDSGLTGSLPTISVFAVPDDTTIAFVTGNPLPSDFRPFNPRAPPVLV